jgi:hypothetical protein
VGPRAGGRVHRRPRQFFAELREELAAAVRAALELDFPGKDGTTVRDHLLQVYEQTGRWDDRLDLVDVPDEGEALWRWFWEIRRDQTVTLSEVEAFGRLNRLRLSPWEVGTILAMDAEILAYVATRARNAGSAKGG